MTEKAEHTRLIAQAMAGDERSFEELAALYKGYILVFCRNMTQSEQAAEDAVQETLIGVWKSIAKLDTPFAFTAWLRTIMTRACTDVNAHEAQNANCIEPLDAAELLPETDSERIPEAWVVQKDENERLYAMIRRLPEMQRRALYLYYYENLNYKEIAGLLGITTNTVGTNIRNAKKSLERMMNARSEKTNILTGAAIAAAFKGDADRYLAKAGVRDFITRPAEATGRAAGRGAVKWLFPACGAAAACFAVVLLLSAVQPPRAPAAPLIPPVPVPLEPAAPAPEAPSATGELSAEISFVSDSALDETVNPTGAKLVLSANHPASWKIVAFSDAAGGAGENGGVVSSAPAFASGAGLTAAIPSGLTPGNYDIVWEVSAAGTADTAGATIVSRTFTVS